MNPLLMFLIAIFSPFLMAITLLLPVYIGITGAAYIIYAKGAAVHPLAGKLFDVFYIIDVYSNLFTQWTAHIGQSDFFAYSAPLIALPVFGAFLALWLTSKLARGLKSLFQHGASV